MNEKKFKDDILTLLSGLSYQWKDIFKEINNLEEGKEIHIDNLKTIDVIIKKKEKQ